MEANDLQNGQVMFFDFDEPVTFSSKILKSDKITDELLAAYLRFFYFVFEKKDDTKLKEYYGEEKFQDLLQQMIDAGILIAKEDNEKHITTIRRATSNEW